MAFSANGQTVASVGWDSTVKLWDSGRGRLLVTLLIVPSGQEGKVSTEWIAFTAEGYYVGSAGAGRFIKWRVGSKLFPAEQYERTFNRPDLLQKVLRGER